MNTAYITGVYQSETEPIPVVSTEWTRKDKIDTLKVRWSIGRMNYKIMPGIYAVGSPGRDSNVFVSANYKLSFDHLRRALSGMNAWILVINTNGINVWCAAGKGTFSTKEVVKRIRYHHLEKLIDHKKIILPQLSATGVAAHMVKKMTGFSVIYGPVKAADIKAFTEAGMKATPEMRTINFPVADRLKLVPVDLFYAKYYLAFVPLFFLLASGFSSSGFSTDLLMQNGWKAVINLYAGYLSGAALTPALLPWIPFRRFSLKGMSVGILMSLTLILAGTISMNLAEALSWILMISGISSFMAMNFTGSSTFTSISGVKKEMKVFLPVQIIMTSIGISGWIITKFITL